MDICLPAVGREYAMYFQWFFLEHGYFIIDFLQFFEINVRQKMPD